MVISLLTSKPPLTDDALSNARNYRSALLPDLRFGSSTINYARNVAPDVHFNMPVGRPRNTDRWAHVHVGTFWHDFSAVAAVAAAAAVAGVTSPSLPPLPPSSSRLASVSYTSLLPALSVAERPIRGTGGVPMPSCGVCYRAEFKLKVIALLR